MNINEEGRVTCGINPLWESRSRFLKNKDDDWIVVITTFVDLICLEQRKASLRTSISLQRHFWASGWVTRGSFGVSVSRNQNLKD